MKEKPESLKAVHTHTHTHTHNTFYQINGNKITTIVIIAILIAFAIIVGINRIETSDFTPINGDFQNYNSVRRLLDGQIPFKDFAVYLGTGHLLILSMIQLFFGNNYTASLFISNMVTMLLFELIVFTVSFFMLKNKKKALYATLGITIINLIRPKFVMNLLDEVFINALNFGLRPGNSARLIRIGILPITALMLYLGLKFLRKSKNENIVKYKSLLSKVYIAFIAGMAILWSNDGGIATYIAISFIYFLLLIKEYKKNIKHIILYTLMYIGISLLVFFIVLFIVTQGNILSWFEFTFGVSSYQRWYYGEAPDKLNISIFDINLSLYHVIMIMIAIYYIYKIFKDKEQSNTIRYALLNVCIIASILSSYLYQLLSGGVSNDILHLILGVWGICTIIQLMTEIIKEKKVYYVAKIATLMIACATIISSIGTINCKFKDRSKYLYINELGGYFSKLGDSIDDAIERIKDEKIFSTYASAIDVATNQFQSTGVDYIIHCMGDKQREKYMENFRKGDFRYVTTTDRDYNGYRYWIRNANWFFYRELYQDYIPVFATEYNVFWEKEKDKNENKVKNHEAKISLNKKNTAMYQLTVKTEDKNFNGIADIKLSYVSNKTKRFLKTGNINRYVYVNDITGRSITNLKFVNYNIPNKSEEYYIPITIVDGIGRIEISSYPILDTSLKIKEAEIVNVYDTNLKYCVSSKKQNNLENVLYIDNTSENRAILKNVKAIKIEEIEQKVTNYSEEGRYIKLQIEGDTKPFAYPNFFEVIK